MKTILFLIVLVIISTGFSVRASSKQAKEDIYLIPHADTSDPFWETAFEGARLAAEESGVNLTILPPEIPNDVVRQVELLHSVIEKNPAGIALTVSDADIFSKDLKKAYKAGIPVIAFNARPENNDYQKNPYLAYIGMDNYQAGKLFAKKALASGKTGKHVLVIMHQPGLTGLEARYKGIHEVFSSRGIQVDKVDTTSEPDKILKIFRRYIKDNPDVKAVFLLGMATFHVIGKYVKDNKAQKNISDLYLCGFDISPRIMELIKSGIVDFSIAQQPFLQTYLTVKLLVLNLRYKMSPPDINTGAEIITGAETKSFTADLFLKKQPDIYFISHAGAGDPFWTTEFNGARAGAKETGAKLTILAPEIPNDVFRQAELLNSIILQNTDGIAITVPDPGMFSKMLVSARKQDIPVLAFNTQPVEEDRGKNPYLAYIGMDDYLAGKVAAGRALASGRIKGRVVYAIQQAGHVGLEARYKGISEILSSQGIVTDKLDTTSDPDMIRQITEEYLKKHPDTGSIFCAGPLPLHSIGSLLKNRGSDIYLCGFDISHQTLEFIKSGLVDFTIDQQPYMQGYLSVSLLALKNRRYLSLPDINTGVGIIDISNVRNIESLTKQGIR